MTTRTFILLLVAALCIGIGAGLWLAPRPAHPTESLDLYRLRTKAIRDSVNTAHIIDSLNRIIQLQYIRQDSLHRLDSLINANPKYQPHAYRDSSTMAKLRFIIGAEPGR